MCLSIYWLMMVTNAVIPFAVSNCPNHLKCKGSRQGSRNLTFKKQLKTQTYK